MCGILGAIDYKTEKDNFIKSLNLMTHRGPDDWGYHEVDNLKFGHRRLSIIDVSKSSSQPMIAGNDEIICIFNGEIYNYKELREDLKTKGYTFKTNGDTEVLINAYHHYKEKCLDLFIGMFSFALYNTKDKSIFLARDRLGIKPLFYSLKSGLIFSSEIKSIIDLDKSLKKPNLRAFSSYLSFRYPIGDDTFFKDILELSPGCYMKYKNGKSSIKRYWDLSIKVNNKQTSSDEVTISRELKKLIKSSVKYRMVSDVPVGAYLSGGVDSSIIVNEMTKLTDNTVNTFTIGFSEEGFNEFEYSQIVAKQLNTNHHEITLDSDQYFDTLESLIQYKDAPLGVPNEVPLYLMSKQLKESITVVLSGEGADEIFAGYGRIFRSADDYIHVNNLSHTKDSQLKEKIEKKYGKNTFNTELDHFLYLYRYTSLINKKEIFHEDINVDDIESQLIEQFKSIFNEVDNLSYAEKMMYTFERLHLPGLLQRVDTTTMAASVEARVPFVDHRLVEYAFSIPFDMKLKWKEGIDVKNDLLGDEISEIFDTPKYILKKSYEGELPNDILYRKKMGFPVPLNKWLGSNISDLITSQLSNGYLIKHNIIKISYIEKINSLKNISHKTAMTIWMLINLELFYKKYFV